MSLVHTLKLKSVAVVLSCFIKSEMKGCRFPLFEATVHVLVSVLRDASPLQQKLKALTIANELMYSPEAVAAFRAANGCREALAVHVVCRCGDCRKDR